MRGKQPEEEPPDLPPEAGRRIWSVFLDLHAARSGNGFGVNPISYQEIDAYTRLMADDLSPYEVTVVKQLDREYMSFKAEDSEATK